jgi:hypothetical protein
MRVTIAAVACLLALVRADAAFAADGPGRPLPATQCAEPARLAPTASFGEAIGGLGFSIGASELAGAAVVPGTGLEAPQAPLAEEHAALWCVSSDDPRCAPIENSSSSGFSIAHAKLGCAFDWSLGVMPPLPTAAYGGRSAYLACARDGVLGRLERPPRPAAV